MPSSGNSWPDSLSLCLCLSVSRSSSSSHYSGYLSTAELEAAAAEHTEDFEAAWDALEMARTIFEQARDELNVAKVRLSLGDACAEVDEWEDAVKEYGDAANILVRVSGDNRRTVEALFLWGLALQMTRKASWVWSY